MFQNSNILKKSCKFHLEDSNVRRLGKLFYLDEETFRKRKEKVED